QAAEAFRQWRAAKSGRGRIPDELWDLACRVAHTHGVAKTAGALKLDRYALQRRMGGRGGARGKAADTPKKRRRGDEQAFVELPPVTNISPQAECELEFENRRGTRLTLRWKGILANSTTGRHRAAHKNAKTRRRRSGGGAGDV
ncbi:MAG: hypothetical protein D6753_17925, partial [Planctomycetota bacterium]